MAEFRVEDLFRIEQFGRYYDGPFAWSPDGRYLAAVIQRCKSTARHHKLSFLWGNDRADVWLVDLDSGKAADLTQGVEDGSGWWAPCWSDDGRLAMLSTRGGTVSLWLWDGSLSRLTDRAVYLSWEPFRRPHSFVPGGSILCGLLGEGERPEPMTMEIRGAETAMAAWPKAWEGREPTSSVVDTGSGSGKGQAVSGQTVLVDCGTGAVRVVAEGAADEHAISPSGRLAALLIRRDARTPGPGRPAWFGFGSWARFALSVVSTAGQAAVSVPARPALHDVLLGTPCWSAGGRLGFLAFEDGQVAPFAWSPGQDTVQRLGTGRLLPDLPQHTPPGILWAADGTLVVRARTEPDSRPDWWAVSDADEHCLTAELPQAPAELLSRPAGSGLAGLAGGQLWALQPGMPPAQVGAGRLPAGLRVEWPPSIHFGDGPGGGLSDAEGLVVSGPADVPGSRQRRFVLDPATLAIEEVAQPSDQARVVSWHRGTVLWAEENQGATCLLVREGETTTRPPVLEINSWLQEIRPGTGRSIRYRSLDGDELTARLLLPPSYQDDHRVPLIISLYPGACHGDTPALEEHLTIPGHLNMQVAAAKGYAVLFPSIPLTDEGQPDDPMLRLPAGVLPAVDKVIDLEIADPDRLYLFGQSYGGFAVYGLSCLTSRFAGGIALAGPCDLFSFYLAQDPRSRYDNPPGPDSFYKAFAESGGMRMAGTPWQALARYQRNSPVFYADRIQTPLLIIQGDMDYVPITQGEEMFQALHRLGKKARFVRYWGEGHIIESPANITDMWEHIFSFLTEISSPPTADPPAGPPS